MRARLASGALLLAWLLCSGVAARAEEFTARVEAVRDGDSLMVRRGGQVLSLRLFGIDAPEWEQPGGRAAARFAAALVGDGPVQVQVQGEDTYGRLLAEVCLPDGRSLNRELVRAGHAWWYRRYTDDPELARLEAQARSARRGLWAAGDPVSPWRWRRQQPPRLR